jgi:hypothetical protein
MIQINFFITYILILNYPLDSQGRPVSGSELLTRFDKSIIRNENQYIYQMEIIPGK